MKESLKEIQREIQETTKRLADVKEDQRTSGKLITELTKSLEALENKMKKATRELVVSEHAVVQWLNRVKGIDLDEVKKEILSEELVALASEYNSGKFTLGGTTFVVADNVVVTIYQGN